MFDRICVPLDGSRLAECTLPHAVALERAFGSELVLARVLQTKGSGHGEMPAVPVGWHIGRAEVEGYVAERAKKLAEAGVAAKTKLLYGEPAESITQFVQSNDVDLIVLSTHRAGGLSRWNVSSVARKVVLGAPTAMMLIRAYVAHQEELDALSYRRLLDPVKGPQAEELIEQRVSGAEQVVEAAAKGLEEHGIETDTETIEGSPADVILRVAETPGSRLDRRGQSPAERADQLAAGQRQPPRAGAQPCSGAVRQGGERE